MKRDGDLPLAGIGSMTLGVRGGTEDIPVGADSVVWPESGGMSVIDGHNSITQLPPHMIPKRLKALFPDAAGSGKVFIWSHGDGEFKAGVISPELTLRPDPTKPWHGFVEPSAIMHLEEYLGALAATRAGWKIDEPGTLIP
jgi:hypothetical protein